MYFLFHNIYKQYSRKYIIDHNTIFGNTYVHIYCFNVSIDALPGDHQKDNSRPHIVVFLADDLGELRDFF